MVSLKPCYTRYGLKNGSENEEQKSSVRFSDVDVRFSKLYVLYIRDMQV